VLLEVSWVLTSFYQYRPDGVRKALEDLMGLPNVRVEDESAVASALRCRRRESISPTRCTWRANRKAFGLHHSIKPSFAGLKRLGGRGRDTRFKDLLKRQAKRPSNTNSLTGHRMLLTSRARCCSGRSSSLPGCPTAIMA